MAIDSISKQAELAIKVLSASAVLTTIMGWPAVGRHFSSFGIPAELVSTNAAISAGILPALTFMAVFGYLLYVRMECYRFLKSHTNTSTLFLPFFMFQIIPIAFIAILVKYIGVFCGFFTLLWIAMPLFGVIIKPWSTVFWIVVTLSFALSIGLIVGSNIFLTRYRDEWWNKHGEKLEEDPLNYKPNSIFKLYYRFIEYIELTKNFIALYFIHFALQLVVPNILSWVSVLVLLVMSAFLSLVSSLIVVGLAISKKETELGMGNLKGSMGFAIITVILTVLLYSVDIYSYLPKSFGGGKPTNIDVWLKESKYPGLNNWTHMQKEEGRLHLTNTYLVHIDDKVVILADQPRPPGQWAIVPRESIELLSAR